MKRTISFLLLAFLFCISIRPSFSQAKEKPSKKDYLITMHTQFGDMLLILYEDTPIHRENFLKLVDEEFYDSTSFHRVIKDFMIQGGDPNTKPGGDKSRIGQGNPGYTIAAEFRKHHTHKKGALAAARKGDRVNPKKESSGSQFYIVQNKKGTPHLDGGYTVYGEVIQGLEVVDKIAGVKVKRRKGNLPVEDIVITVSAKKMSKKKITKEYGYSYE